ALRACFQKGVPQQHPPGRRPPAVLRPKFILELADACHSFSRTVLPNPQIRPTDRGFLFCPDIFRWCDLNSIEASGSPVTGVSCKMKFSKHASSFTCADRQEFPGNSGIRGKLDAFTR